MLTIGAFARLGGVSVRALRHYEQIGALVPDRIDPVTGYRYYRAHQLARLHRLQALQDLGLSLQQLAPMLDDELSAEQLSGMLVFTRAQLAEQVADHQARLARVEQRLRYIELEDDMSTGTRHAARAATAWRVVMVTRSCSSSRCPWSGPRSAAPRRPQYDLASVG